ncbi:MAG: DUF2911 domain-containing protein, partial [Gemmatimonadaceae bacterium]
MRNFSAAIVFAVAASTAQELSAQAVMNVAPSGRGTTEVTLVLADSAARAASTPSKIRIDFGQPHLRGRRILTDSLVPYDRRWRTGANDATTLTTDVDIVLGGATIPKGKYVLETLPSRSGWKLIVQKDVEVPAGTPAPEYDPANDVARIDLRQTTLGSPLESLTFWLIPSREPR